MNGLSKNTNNVYENPIFINSDLRNNYSKYLLDLNNNVFKSNNKALIFLTSGKNNK